MSLSGQQRQTLQEALINAFPSKSSLEQMLSFQLNKSLDTFAGGDNLQVIVFNIIKIAEAEDWVENLIEAARKSNPGNKLLKDIATELLSEIISEKPEILPTSQSPSKPTQQQKILILAAIPHGLRLDIEMREIEEAIRRSIKRDLFEIRIRTAVRPQDIRRAIAEEEPQIVHFCGHGLEDGSLLLEDEERNNKPVSPEALASLFELHAEYVKCVLLNACYSEKPAVAISQYISYVIGMNNPIKDRASIALARGFYDGLSYKISENQDVFQRAFDEAVLAVKLENPTQGQIPVLKKKIYQPNLIYEPLLEIPMKGDEASEVGADYTKLREFLEKKEFGKADLETASKILWVAKRDNYGWLEREDLETFPSKDLRTINKLWLAASKGKFGFSVQKQIWIDLGGKPGQYDETVFDNFIEKVEWAKNRAIIFDQRAVRGHLPLGMYVKVDGHRERISNRWGWETDQIRQKEIADQKEKIRKKEEEIESLRVNGGNGKDIIVMKDKIWEEMWERVLGDLFLDCNEEWEPPSYPFFLSRKDL